MLTKTIEYEDYNGEKVKETLRFNLTQPEQLRLTAKYFHGDTEDEKVFATQLKQKKSASEIVEMLEDLILSSYGELQDDGLHFKKTKQIREDFEYSLAYAELFTELFQDQNAMVKFMQGVLARKKEQPAPAKVTQASVVK